MNRMCLNGPELKIPAPLRAAETGTWTHKSVVSRLPGIGRRIIEENFFSKDTVKKLKELIDEIPYSPIRMLQGDLGPDVSEWNRIIAPYCGENWLDVPWLFVEFYFYRRILEVTGYFDPEQNYLVDPYVLQKEQGLRFSERAVIDLCRNVEAWRNEGIPVERRMEKLLRISLWGNQLDLSIWPAEGSEAGYHAEDIENRSHIVVDDSADAVSHYFRTIDKDARVDVILDNAGFEMFCDLILADFLLREGCATQVCFHLKAIPIYVSDTMIKDIYRALDFCLHHSHPEVVKLGERIQNYLKTRRLFLRDEFFWTSSQKIWSMPEDLKKDLWQSNLLIFKGDANFRRLVGDVHWPYSTSFKDITRYIQVPVLSLRIYKSEIAAGLQDEKVRMLSEQEADWMINGKWGMSLWYAGI